MHLLCGGIGIVGHLALDIGTVDAGISTVDTGTYPSGYINSNINFPTTITASAASVGRSAEKPRPWRIFIP